MNMKVFNHWLLRVLLLHCIFLIPLHAQDFLITYLEGEVTVFRGSKDFMADFGTTLKGGDRIATGAESLAIIDLSGSRTLKLNERTILELENLGTETSLKLSEGGLFSKVDKLTSGSFTVRTETVVAGVRGTEFFISFAEYQKEDSPLWLCVNHGSVEVSLVKTDESVLVREGEGINIPSVGRLPPPRYYSWTEELNWNTDPSAGKVKNDTPLNEKLYRKESGNL